MFELKPASEVKVGDWIETRDSSDDWTWLQVDKNFTNYSPIETELTLEDGTVNHYKMGAFLLTTREDPKDVKNRHDVPEWDDYFLGIAKAVSARAKCRRRSVGAVIVDSEKRIIASGYNGFPSGVTPDCLEGGCPRGLTREGIVKGLSSYEDPESEGYCPSIHAELNALLHTKQSLHDTVIYITDPPCNGCLKHLAAAGVIRAVWPNGTIIPLSVYKISRTEN